MPTNYCGTIAVFLKTRASTPDSSRERSTYRRGHYVRIHGDSVEMETGVGRRRHCISAENGTECILITIAVVIVDAMITVYSVVW